MVWHHRGPRLLCTRGSARLRIARRTTWTVLVGSLVGFAVLVGSPMDDGLRLLRDLILYNLVHLAAACLCWWPSAATRSSVRAWRLLAVATVFATAGNVCATLTPDAPGLLSPTLSDELHLAFYPVASIAVILLAYDHRRRPAPAGWLDGLMVGLASAAVAAALVLAPMLRRDSSTSAQAITHLAYPAADLTLLIVLIVLATVGGVTRPRVDPRLALLAVGLGLHLVTDLTYLLLDPAGHDRDGGPVALGWLSAVAVLATAACHRETTRHPDRDTPAKLDGSTTAVAPTLSGLAALAVLVAGCRTTLPPAADELAAACLLIALLRTALTLRQLRALPAARREARTDPLTDLANRRHLQEHCTGLLARPDAAPVSLLMIDLNDFKIVNDRHGHLAGDLVLAQVAARLGAVIRDRDLLGRLGGDEFVALLPNTTPGQAQLVAQRMQAELATPITLAGHQVHVGASIGISTAARPGSTATSLFHAADTAMYRAKNTHTGTTVAETTDNGDNFTHRDTLARSYTRS